VDVNQAGAADEVRGARIAERFFAAPARRFFSPAMIWLVVEEFCRRNGPNAVSDGFAFWSGAVARQRQDEIDKEREHASKENGHAGI